MSKPAAPRKTKPFVPPANEFLDDCLEALEQLDDLTASDIEDIVGTARRVNENESFD
ncbi:MAG: hypothetical protein ACXW25_12190 [Rhodospirillales bacterium]|nr:hypothetical protein [Rhodospirillales bacterium]